MTESNKTTGEAFRTLVKEKLAERGWKQSFLADRISKSRSYIGYVMRGENPSARGGKFSLKPDVVENIARELGIPIEEAFAAAELPAGLIPQRSALSTDKKQPGPKETEQEALDDTQLVDTVYKAALAAVRSVGTGAGGIKIDLGGEACLTLHGIGRDLTDDEIARCMIAFRVAFETVNRLG